MLTNCVKKTDCSKQLCHSREELQKGEIMFTGHFHDPGYTVAIRPLIASDFIFAYEWYREKYALQTWHPDGPAKYIEDTYTIMLRSDIAQPFMILMDDQPVCVAEIYKGLYSELGIEMNMLPGDYVLQIQYPPLLAGTPHDVSNIVQCCLQYFFNHKEVKRIVVNPEKGDQPLLHALLQTAFRPYRHPLAVAGPPDMGHVKENIYECCRENFLSLLG